MTKQTILWADDEIDLLKAHLIFLSDKGYRVLSASNGAEALEIIKKETVDLVLLDENMPGYSGLEVLAQMKEKYPQVPVVMITKSEEEHIMEDAIGSKISDYLIKPVHPKQILSSIKKNLDNKRLISEKSAINYQQEFRQLANRISENMNAAEWADLYKKLVYWNLELERTKDNGLTEIFDAQMKDAGRMFARFVEKNYLSWIQGNQPDAPVLSHNFFRNLVLPELEGEDHLFFFLIDNLRFDQWKIIQEICADFLDTEKEDIYYSILPTATQYARNAIFAGMMPSDIEKRMPTLWKNEEDEESKNQFEEAFLTDQLKRLGLNIKCSYHKISSHGAGKKLSDQFGNLFDNRLNVIVYNFVDMLSHARTEMEIIRELADNESAYRSITRSWFEHSPLLEMLKQAANRKARIVISTDHGTICVKEPIKVIGDRQTNTNLRYKTGRNLDYNRKDVFEVKNPFDARLPKQHVSSSYIFAREDAFFAYPNNYNHYVSYYRNTFQHGGISMEEMLIPFAVLKPKM
ncbi:MAG: response regulator [Bacteroidota bacterium]|jgi:DNA-binding response OmpR family regulator